MRVPPQLCLPFSCMETIQGYAPSCAISPFTMRVCFTEVRPHWYPGRAVAGGPMGVFVAKNKRLMF